MPHKVAIDFGTTNSVVVHKSDKGGEELVTLPGLSQPALDGQPPIVPSLVYVRDGSGERLVVGQTARDENLNRQHDNRLFRNFKRGIVASPAPPPREIDGTLWADRDAGRVFLQAMLAALPYELSEVEQLAVSVPVVAFEGYLEWLTEAMPGIAPEKIRVVDESTAAALGYGVTQPGALVLVFDFGGGSLDLSLVQLPESREKAGGLLGGLLGGESKTHAARVIAKAGRILGGSDVDQWLLAHVLRESGLTPADVGHTYAALLTACEQAKIALSTQASVSFDFEVGEQPYSMTLTRERLESILDENGFFAALRAIMDKVLHTARQRGIFREDVHYVLMVGGTSLMPSVQALLGDIFGADAVQSHKPFTAVAEGALEVAAGAGLQDYLVHSYGLRYLDESSGEHRYEEIISMGSAYPASKPVEVRLGAAHAGQPEVEFVIGEIDAHSVEMIEVQYENGQAVFVARANSEAQAQVIPLNAGSAQASHETLARLNPAGKPGKDRLKAAFRVDEQRHLRVTVRDTKTKKRLLDDVMLVTLR